MTEGEVAESATSSPAPPDWDALRKRSLEPYGFGEARRILWPQLLHIGHTEYGGLVMDTPAGSSVVADVSNEPDLELSADLDDALAHRDERQIGLDTNRSFVLYPVDDGPDRERLKKQLHELIVSVFRKRRHLNYFQGYHDIVSVLFLTLPHEVQLLSVEKMSLHRLRDAMGMTLEPVVGLLRVLKKLLQVADPEFSSILERTSPLPYFALSNILTLFAHDVPKLSLIQHIFDYLLCRHPVAVVYLVAAVLLSRRDEVRQLVEEGDEGMIHSVLSTLPELYEEDDHAIPGEVTDEVTEEPAVASHKELSHARTANEQNVATPVSAAGEDGPVDGSDDAMEVASVSAMSDTSSTVGDDVSTTVGPDSEAEDSFDEKVEPFTPSTAPSAPVEHPSSDAALDHSHLEVLSEKRPDSRVSIATESDDVPPRARVSLTSVLMQADELYERFSLSHPSIALSSIMGPQSVMLTWSEDASELPSDDDAELMVTKPGLVVLPYIEPDDEVDSEDEGVRPKGRAKPRRRLKKPRHLVLQRKTMVAGAVLVLGVAVAVYGIQSGGSAGLFRSFAETRHQRHSLGREWKRMSSFVGGVVLGVGERIFEPLLHGV